MIGFVQAKKQQEQKKEEEKATESVMSLKGTTKKVKKVTAAELRVQKGITFTFNIRSSRY
jgi:hypothetical protein